MQDCFSYLNLFLTPKFQTHKYGTLSMKSNSLKKGRQYNKNAKTGLHNEICNCNGSLPEPQINNHVICQDENWIYPNFKSDYERRLH